MESKFKIGQLVKFKNDKAYKERWNKSQKAYTLPVAGIILDIRIDDWVHPYYGMSKHFEKKASQIEVATIKWFEYAVPSLGKSDDFNLDMYTRHHKTVPTLHLSDFDNYLKSLTKKKVLYK